MLELGEIAAVAARGRGVGGLASHVLRTCAAEAQRGLESSVVVRSLSQVLGVAPAWFCGGQVPIQGLPVVLLSAALTVAPRSLRPALRIPHTHAQRERACAQHAAG